MEKSEILPGSLRENYNKLLSQIKLELQRILRDNGKCFSFGNFGKNLWIDFPARPGYTLVYLAGDILWCDKVGNKPNLKPGKDPSVFDPSRGIPIPELLKFIDLYPSNPFS